MKKRFILLSAALLASQAIPALAEEAETVQVIGQTSGQEISIGESVDLGDYEIKISNVQISQNAGIELADPAHKYLCFDVNILNWMLDDLAVDPVANWSVVYDDAYDFQCAVYKPSLTGTWEGLATYNNGNEIYYVIEITNETENGTLSGITMRMRDDDHETANSSWNVSGSVDKTTGNVSLVYGDYIQQGNNRVSFNGTLRNSAMEMAAFADGGDIGEVVLKMDADTASKDLAYATVIEPLVEEQYTLCVLLANEAAEGLEDGSLVLNMVIGEDHYAVRLG